MKQRRKYSASQRRAYYSGQGYRVAYGGKAIPFKNDKNKESFRQGYKSVKGRLSRYPDLKS